jgi:hypothetical protein
MSRLIQVRRWVHTRWVGATCALVLMSVSLAHASATLLLEEPYGKLGFFTATGHAAVYLSGVCADTPLVLRACKAGELGSVISRYNGVGGYDWVAIPLVPYLYAVEKPEDVPLFADPRIVSFLRDQYRRKYLEGVVPDVNEGKTPGGNWYELVGSAYDRATYAFEIETSAAQDQAFIATYNAAMNHSNFHTVSRNCADFAKDVINFYHPHALHRSVVADIGITTPKQIAKTMVKLSARHPELEFSHYVIPQIPGSAARSTAVHGVVESFFKSKKYIGPSIAVSPIFAGSVAAVYIGSGAGRFDPNRQAMVYNAERGLEPPIGAEDRRSYELELSHLKSAQLSRFPNERSEKNFARMLNNGVPAFDADGRPILQLRIGDEAINLGVAEGNLLSGEATQQLSEDLLEARLEQELRRGNPPKVSESDVEHDWKLLQQALNSSEDQIASRDSRPLQAGAPSRWSPTGNRP